MSVIYSMEYFGLPEPFDMDIFKKEFRLDGLARELLKRMLTRTFIEGKAVSLSRSEVRAKMRYSKKRMWMREDGRAIIQTNRKSAKRSNRTFAGFRAKWMRSKQPRGGVLLSTTGGGMRKRTYTTKAGIKRTYVYDRSKTHYKGGGRSGGEVGTKHTWRYYDGGYAEFAKAMGARKENLRITGQLMNSIAVTHKEGVIDFHFKTAMMEQFARKFTGTLGSPGIFPFGRRSALDRRLIRSVLKSEIARIFGLIFKRARKSYKGPTWGLGGQRVRVERIQP